MPEGQIFFHSEDISFILKNKKIIRNWLRSVIEKESKELAALNFVFCSDSYLHRLNIKYLNHDTLTDVITFDYSNKNCIAGDIYISTLRVKQNALEHNSVFLKELMRVMVHGALHLTGYKDKSKKDKQRMTEKEDYYLSLFPF